MSIRKVGIQSILVFIFYIIFNAYNCNIYIFKSVIVTHKCEYLLIMKVGI